MADFNCPHCGYKIAGAKGDATRCQGCGQQVQVPKPPILGLVLVGLLLLLCCLWASYTTMRAPQTLTFQAIPVTSSGTSGGR